MNEYQSRITAVKPKRFAFPSSAIQVIPNNVVKNIIQDYHKIPRHLLLFLITSWDSQISTIVFDWPSTEVEEISISNRQYLKNNVR